MKVSTLTPDSARLSGPASAMQKLGEVATANEVMGLVTLVVMSEAGRQNCFVSLSCPEQITREDAGRLKTEMPVFLMGENERPMRSENVSGQFANLCGVVNEGKLYLTTRSVVTSGARLN